MGRGTCREASRRGCLRCPPIKAGHDAGALARRAPSEPTRGGEGSIAYHGFRNQDMSAFGNVATILVRSGRLDRLLYTPLPNYIQPDGRSAWPQDNPSTRASCSRAQLNIPDPIPPHPHAVSLTSTKEYAFLGSHLPTFVSSLCFPTSFTQLSDWFKLSCLGFNFCFRKGEKNLESGRRNWTCGTAMSHWLIKVRRPLPGPGKGV